MAYYYQYGIVVVMIVLAVVSAELPVCKTENEYVSYNNSVQSIGEDFFCFFDPTSSSDICTHSSGSGNELKYIPKSLPSGMTFYQDKEKACLYLTSLDLKEAEVCLAYTARASATDEQSANPATICVVFNNEGPVIPPDQSTFINLADKIETRNIPVEISSADGISNFEIINVSEAEIENDLTVNLKTLEMILSTEVKFTFPADINVTIRLTDNGNPKLSTDAVFLLQITDEAITCSDLNFVLEYDNVSTGTVLGSPKCDSKSKSLNYSLAGEHKEYISIESSTGEMALLTGPLEPNVYNYIVIVQSKGLTVQFNVELDIGKAPQLLEKDYNLKVIDRDEVGKCFNIITVDPSIPVTTFETSNDKFQFPDSNSTLCIVSDLFPVDRQPYDITVNFSVSNKYGKTLSYVSVRVEVVYILPEITLIPNTDVEILETIKDGTVISRLTVGPEGINSTVVISDPQDAPFGLVEVEAEYHITVNGSLDAAVQNVYTITLKASNIDGSRTKTFQISIKANSAPTCKDKILTATIEIKPKTFQIVAETECTDAEGETISYSYASGTPSYITETIGVRDDKCAVFAFVNNLEYHITVEEMMNLKFDIAVSDSNGNIAMVRVDLRVNVPSPTCQPPPNRDFSLTETEGSFCKSYSSLCTSHFGEQQKITYIFRTGLKLNTTTEDEDTEICGNTSDIAVGVYQIGVIVNDGFQTILIGIKITITAVNKHAPIFKNLTDEVTLDIPEITAIGSDIFTFVVVDDDDGDFGKFTVTGTGKDTEPFEVESDRVNLLQKLNASSTASYILYLTAIDTGGLNDSLTLNINVADVNDPPVCNDQVTFNISKGKKDGVVGQITCYDYDVNSDFNQITYQINQPSGDTSVPFAVEDDGTLKVTGSLLEQDDTIEFTVEASTGDKKTSIPVTINLSNSIPPECNSSTIDTTFTESSSGCSPEKIRCTHLLTSFMTMDITNSRPDDLEIRITNDTVEELDIRVCLIRTGKNWNSNPIQLIISNDYGLFEIDWSVDMENRSPKFANSTYEYQIPEITSAATIVGTISVSDKPDPGNPDILLVDPDSLDQLKVKHITVTGHVVNKVTKQQIPNAAVPITYDDLTFKVTDTLKPEQYYEFEVQAEDGGGKKTSTIVTFDIDDVNEVPSCTEDNIQLELSLLQGLSEVVKSVDCQDKDFDENFKSLTYSLVTKTPDVFAISKSGAIYLDKKLPRDEIQHLVSVIVKDGGGLATTSSLTINVNRDIGADCNPVITPPNVWFKDECITINSNCVDPTADDTSTITYQATGNYQPDFYVSDRQDGANGILKLCYFKTENGDYEITMKVDNGLYPTILKFNITVLYSQSVPKFSSEFYSRIVTEDFGASVITVTAESTGNFSGNVSYALKETDPTDAINVFSIDTPSGEIRTTKSLRPYSNQDVKITVEAQDSRSLLVSTTVVTVTVQDVNEKPTCTGPSPIQLTVDANKPVGSVVYTFNCSDPDVKPEYKQLQSELSGSSHFTVVGNDLTVAIELPITSSPIDLVFNITDGLLSVVVPVQISISFEPSAPEVANGLVTTNSIEISWSYTRPEAVSFIDRHIVEFGPEPSEYTVVKNSVTSYKFDNLQPAKVYSFRIIAETNKNTNLTSLYGVATTRAIPILTRVLMMFKVTNREWKIKMVNNQSDEYKQLKQEIEKISMLVLSNDRGLHGIEIFNMRPGSVIFDGIMFVNQSGTVQETSQTFIDQIYTGVMGDLNVQDGAVYKTDPHISSTSLTLLAGDPDELLEGTSVEYACKFRFVSTNSQNKPIVKWFLDETPLIVTHRPKIKMRNSTDPNDRFGYRYIIQFDKAIPSHAGLLKCLVQSSTDSEINATETEKVKIISKPVIMLWPLSSFLKTGESVTLKCSSTLSSSSPVTYTWFDAKTNSKIPAESKDVYTVTFADKDIHIYCKGENLAGTTQSPTATIHFTPPDVESLPCGRSIDARNTTWPPVKAGTKVKLTCGENYSGFAQRSCSESGVWDPPNYINCTRINLIGLKRETEDVIDGKLVTTPDRTLQMLADLTTDGPKLAAGDVEVSVQILKDVVDITNDDSQVMIGKPELKNLAQSASNILDADDEEWITLAEQGKSGIAVMIDTVDAMAKLSSSRLETKDPVTASTDKMIIEIGRSSLSDIEFPRPTASDYPEWLTQSSNKAFIGKNTLDNYFKDDKEIGYNAVFYNDISKIVEGRILNPGETIDSKDNKTTDINSRILAFSINPPPVGKLDPPIQLSFQHLSDNYSSPSCVFLDLEAPYDKRGRWSTEGCKTESTSNPNVTICKCDHLTNFAILMSPGRTPLEYVHVEALSIISAVGCAISILCLLLTIGVYFYLWRYVKSDKAIILMNLCVTLIIAYIIFLGGVNRIDITALCQTVAVLLHYFFLVVFFLMLAEGVEVFITVVYVFAFKSRLKWILAGSWGIPVIIVGVSLAITQLEGYGNDKYCWLSLESGLLWAFVGPALAVILVNTIIMFKVLTVMFSTTTMVTKSMKEKGRTGLKALCVLLPIIGLTWVFGVFSVNGYTVVFQYLFAIFNSLQGFFIFLFHCLLNRQVKDGYKIKRRRYRAKSIDTGSTSKSFTHVPMQSNQTKSTSNDDKDTNDLNKKTSPFLEADRQVQELAEKLAKVDKNNIKMNANKANIPVKSDISIFDDPAVDDLYVPVSRISQNKSRNSQKKGAQNVEDSSQKGYYSDHSSRKSDPKQTAPDVTDHPRSGGIRIDDYDRLGSDRKSFRDYTKLDNQPPPADYGDFAEPVRRKMPSIEDNSKQSGYYHDPSIYPASRSRRELSPTRHNEPIDPKTKPKPKRVDDEDKEDPVKAYEAVDAYYMGSTLPAKDPYTSRSRKQNTSTSSPNLNQSYHDNHHPKDKWAKLKESKRRGPYPSEIPVHNRRGQSHENLYRPHASSYQPTEVHILHDSRGRPVSHRAPAYHRGWPDGRGGFNY